MSCLQTESISGFFFFRMTKPQLQTERGFFISVCWCHNRFMVKFLTDTVEFNWCPCRCFPPQSMRTQCRIKLLWISTWVCPSKCLCVPAPPPLVVLRQQVSSPTYPSVLFSRPPLRQRTRVYYSLRKSATPEELRSIIHVLRNAKNQACPSVSNVDGTAIMLFADWWTFFNNVPVIKICLWYICHFIEPNIWMNVLKQIVLLW